MKIDEALLRRVDERVRATLAHKDVPHPKLIVTFSAPPSAGKSTVAKQLTQRLQAVRLENDTVRTLAAEWFPESSLQEYSDLAHSYCDYSWPRLAQEIPNGLWVIDSSLDRNYQVVFDFAKQYEFALFVVALEIPEDLHKEWIVVGGDRPFASAATYLEMSGQRRQEQAAFLAKHTPDLTLRPPYDIDLLTDMVRDCLQKLESH